MGEIRIVSIGKTRGYPYPVCKKPCSFSLSFGSIQLLDKLLVPGHPTNLENSRARAYYTCSRRGWGCLDIFSQIFHFSFLSPSLWQTARHRLKHCLKEPLNPKQPTSIEVDMSFIAAC